MQFFEDAKPEPWVPPSLRDLPDAPVFQMRPPRHGASDLRYEVIGAGLHFYPDARLREETIRALRALWAPDDADDNINRVESLWAAMDRGEKLAADDAAALDDLEARLRRAWPPLNRMAADNARFWEMVPAVAVSLTVAGWSGLNVPYRRDGGCVPLDRIEAVAKALSGIEEGAALEPGVAFLELSARAFEVVNGGEFVDTSARAHAVARRAQLARQQGSAPGTDTSAPTDGTDPGPAIMDTPATDEPSAKPAGRRNRKEER